MDDDGDVGHQTEQNDHRAGHHAPARGAGAPAALTDQIPRMEHGAQPAVDTAAPLTRAPVGVRVNFTRVCGREGGKKNPVNSKIKRAEEMRKRQFKAQKESSQNYFST